MKSTTLLSIGIRILATTLLLLVLAQTAVAEGADNSFAAFHQPSGDWYEAGDAMLNPGQSRLLVGKPGTGVLINGKLGKCPSLVTRRRDYRDVEVHVEFMVAQGSNSGIIFHGNHEIQILDSYGIEKPNAGHCGGIYPRAENEPTYHHIDKGSPPRVNAAKQPGQWQTMDIIFQAARFDEDGKKTAHAKFVKVVHNGQVIQENEEVPYACGPNWDRKQFPQGPIIIQGDYGPIAVRNVRIKEWKADEEKKPNAPPEGFTALFNGKDLTGWHTPPLVREYWSIEDGVLKSPGLIENWGASLSTKKHYRDFILMLDFRMPTISDSGINFRRLIPEIPGFGDMEQFNLRSKGGMGHLESYYFLPKETAKKMRLKEEEKPHVRHIDPEVGVWHTVKLTMKGRTFSAEYDGELIHDNFEYHDWMLNMEPAPIRLQKHIVVHGDNLGKENPCPIEYRNIFIKELEPGAVDGQAQPSAKAGKTNKPLNSPLAALLSRIDRNDLPKSYDPIKHQDYVDRRMAQLSEEQRGRIGQLWKEKERIDADMPNRGFSFVRIMEYVAEGERSQKKSGSTETKTEMDAKMHDTSKKGQSVAIASSAAKRPNVVLLLADDLGWKDIGCYDGPVKTPTLDKLAAGGVRFTDFHSGAAVCSPSRATLLTGRQHLRAGIYSWIHPEQRSHLLQREVTLAEVLKSHGYDTVHLGKWHLGLSTHNREKPTPSDHGFDYWFATGNNAQPSHKNPVNLVRNGKPVGETEGYACQVVIDEAITWLDEKRDPNKPFFLNVWFHEPHAPIAAPHEIVARYGKLNDPAAIYSGTIDNTDLAIARLLKKLEQVDSPENTLIVYSSDNGSYRADRVGHLRGTKGSNFEGGIRVPGIFHWPGTITTGHIEHEPSGLVDLLPTVCGLLGIDKPEGVHLDGSDLSPLLTGRADQFSRHQPLFWLLPASGPAVAIRDGNYTLVAHRSYQFPRDQAKMTSLMRQIEETLRKNGTLDEEIRGSTLQKQMFEGFKDKEAEQLRGQFIRLNMFNESWIPAIKAGTYGDFELFDLATDPSQKTDISSQHPDVCAKLKQQLLKINASVMLDAPDWSALKD